MNSKAIKFSVTSMVALAAAVAATSASALTLNTTALKSDAIFTLTLDAEGSMNAAGVTIAPSGNSTTTALPRVPATDIGGNTGTVSSFNMPITTVDIKVGLDLKVKPNSGQSNGAALRLQSIDGGDAVLANFKVDYNAKIVYADLFDVYLGTVEKQVPLYNFTEYKPQVLSLKGLVLNQRTYCGNLTFTETMKPKLVEALLIREQFVPALSTLKWGTIDTVVTSYKRSPALSGKPYTLADVPNQPQP